MQKDGTSNHLLKISKMRSEGNELKSAIAVLSFETQRLLTEHHSTTTSQDERLKDCTLEQNFNHVYLQIRNYVQQITWA